MKRLTIEIDEHKCNFKFLGAWNGKDITIVQKNLVRNYRANITSIRKEANAEARKLEAKKKDKIINLNKETLS